MTAAPLRIHLIAICGTGMGALAVMLKTLGHHVTGSDQDVYPPMSTLLEAQGISVFQGFDVANLTPEPDLVVIGNAISRGNPEAEAVLERKIRYQSMPEALKAFFLWDRQTIVVTGTHGKTTTTTLIAWLLQQAGFDPSYIIGGVPIGWPTGAHFGDGRYFILEGDEYDSAFFDKRAKFLHYLPDIAVINNIEYDHADIYETVDEITLAFRRFVNLIPRNGLLIGSATDDHVKSLFPRAFCPIQTFGEGTQAQWSARQITTTPSGLTFTVTDSGTDVGTVTVPLYGAHNVNNTLAAIAVACQVNVPWNSIVDGLRTFPGVKRRLEERGVVNGITVYDDFAHHPTAIAVTLTGLRAAYPESRIWAVYEPRTATSIRRVFQAAYTTAFDASDRICIAPVFNPYKAPEDNRFSIEELIVDLRARGKDAVTLPDVETIIQHLVTHALPGDRIVIMSNGGFGGIHERLLQALRETE